MPQPVALSRLFEEAVAVLAMQGFKIRYDHLGGDGTGHCQAGEELWMVIDVAQPVDEQLDELAAAIASRAIPAASPLSESLALLCQRHAAPANVLLGVDDVR